VNAFWVYSYLLTKKLLEQKRFIADVHLGKLARILRLLGFNTTYKNSYTTKELIQLSLEEERILLSRNMVLPKQNASLRFFLVRSEDAEEQIRQVIEELSLHRDVSVFSRCLVCNGDLSAISKDSIQQDLLPNTARYFNEFWQCNECHRIYWKGSHYDRMRQLIDQVVQQ
jgi:uncharacterized protein with PIN domain